MTIALQYPLGSYNASNKPSNETLKGDLSTIQTAVNTQEDEIALKLDSTVLDTDGTLAANSDTKIASQKAVKTYADNHGSPTGSILPFAGSSAPTGFLIADGASLLRADYAALFAVISTTYGSADGTHFTLPNLKGKVVVGVNASETEFDVLGETGGEKTHTLTGAESGEAGHNHTQNAHNHSYEAAQTSGVKNLGWGGGSNWGANTISTGNATATNNAVAAANAASAHNNLQPYISLNYIIKT